MLITTSQLARLVIPAGIKVVSLDLFDTLLLRNVDPPEVTIRLVAERIVERALLPVGAQEYQALRGKVEAGLRAEANERGGDAECSLAEISCRITEKLRLPPEMAERLIDTELEVESLIIDPNPEVVALIRRLGNRHRVVAVSDTYFDSEQLARLLAALELGCLFSRVYASCEWGVTKQSGRLFDKVLAEEGVDPGEMIHLGDNFHGDYLSPSKRGIRAVFLYDPETLNRKRSLRRALSKGRHADLYRLYFDRSDRDGWYGSPASPYRFGRQLMGPLLTIFTARLVHELRGQGCPRLFFVARDGFLLQRLYRELAPDLGGREEHYLSLSRYTAALASISVLGPREVVLAGFACITLQDALHRLGVGSLPEIEGIAARLGLPVDTPVQQEELYLQLRKLFEQDDFRSPVLLAAARMRAGLERYLEGEGFFGTRPAALVDIGWHGTIQECLHVAFGHRPDFPPLVGYYVAVMPPFMENPTTRKGLILDYRQASPEESAIALHRELWELSTRAFHGTTTGYVEWVGHTVPVRKREGTPEKRAELNGFVLEIQRGVLDCTRDFARMNAVIPADLAFLKEIALSEYDLAVSFPEGGVAELFERLSHPDDFGSGRFTPLVRSFAWREIIAGRRFLGEFLDNPWREASLVCSRLPFLSLYQTVKKLICWRRGARYYAP
ncbi:MAG: hypothetical protein EG822_09880 [Deltaproteobacteria bacterium]|nr:hypothetical protein [Deltaproteobacteria bacterium]TLN02255.1 MAG: hypothetical protein FDZ73_12455 [bacterium]